MTRVLLAVMVLTAVALAATVVIPPTAKVEQIAYKTEELTIELQGGGSQPLARPYVTPGQDYVYAGMKVEFLGVYPSIQVGADGQLSKTFDQNGFLSAVYLGPDASKLTIVNTGRDKVQLKIKVTYTYVKPSYLPLTGDTVLTLNVPDVKLPPGFSAMARVTLEPYAPYSIKAVERPDGTPATVYRVEPKVVEINAPGTYKVAIGQGQPLPPAMLVKSLARQAAAVAPNGQLSISGAEVGVPGGWSLLGYVVFAYTGDLNVVGKQAAGDIAIQGGLVDTVSDVSQNVIVRSVSYLIPPVWNVNIRYKIALVYGQGFTIASSMTTTVNVIYVPIVYKAAQVKWMPDRALVNVTEADLADGQWTAIVLQLPEVARIASIRTPSNAIVSNATDVALVWGTGIRMASVSPDGRQAYMVIHMGDTREAGLYTFTIAWSPVKIPVQDKKGRPVADITAASDKFEAYAAQGAVYVKVYRPEPFTLSISYRGVHAADVQVNSLAASLPPVALGIYDVRITVVGALSQPISGAAVSLDGFPASGTTDGSGSVTFTGVLEGAYALKVDVGGRVKVSEPLTVAGDTEKVVKTPIVAIVGGVPITTLDVLATAGGASAVGLYFALRARRRGEEPVAEVEQL